MDLMVEALNHRVLGKNTQREEGLREAVPEEAVAEPG